MNAPSALQANREPGFVTTKGVSESYLPNATMAPEITAAGSKGISDLVTANLTLPPSPQATLASPLPGTPAPIPTGPVAQPAAALMDPALAFFLGGFLVILVLVMYEVYLWKKTKSPRG